MFQEASGMASVVRLIPRNVPSVKLEETGLSCRDNRKIEQLNRSRLVQAAVAVAAVCMWIGEMRCVTSMFYRASCHFVVVDV